MATAGFAEARRRDARQRRAQEAKGWSLEPSLVQTDTSGAGPLPPGTAASSSAGGTDAPPTTAGSFRPSTGRSSLPQTPGTPDSGRPRTDRPATDFDRSLVPPHGDIGFQNSHFPRFQKPQEQQVYEYKQLPTDVYRHLAERGRKWGIGSDARVDVDKYGNH